MASEQSLARAKELIEQKKKEKAAEDARVFKIVLFNKNCGFLTGFNLQLAKERELERRKTGQDLQTFKQRQDELELKQMKVNKNIN